MGGEHTADRQRHPEVPVWQTFDIMVPAMAALLPAFQGQGQNPGLSTS